MKLKVVNTSGKEAGGEVELSAEVFGIEPNDHAIYLDVKQFLANQRQGNSKTKQRHELSGSTRKIKRQKGTGTARAGSIKSGIFRGGYRMHGPQVRDYGFKLNKKVKRLARKSALSYKAKDNQIIVIDDLKMDSAKTKNYIEILNNLNVAGERSLFVIPSVDKNVHLSSRNVANSEVMAAADLNTYEILKAKKLVIAKESLDKIQETLN
jgi:large subunit ribosomal protein L4